MAGRASGERAAGEIPDVVNLAGHDVVEEFDERNSGVTWNRLARHFNGIMKDN